MTSACKSWIIIYTDREFLIMEHHLTSTCQGDTYNIVRIKEISMDLSIFLCMSKSITVIYRDRKFMILEHHLTSTCQSDMHLIIQTRGFNVDINQHQHVRVMDRK